MGEVANVWVEPGGDSVEVRGDLDLRSADSLDAAIAGLADSRERVFVDLTRATLLDSRIIAVLTSWATRLRARGGSLPIVCSDPNVRRLFEAIGLDREFEFLGSHPDG